jgi:enoyl-CoA hydratase
MSVAPGHSFNSGAGLLASSGFPSICHNSKIAFNECTFGFVPHAGTAYYASRLPGDFGTFLVLTGAPLGGKDAIGLGLADALIEIPETYEDEITGLVQAMDPTSMPTARLAAGAQAGSTGAASK